MNKEELNECITCLKEEEKKIICSHRAYPFNWANISSLNMEGKCKERERLFTKGGKS
uniref:Uncharacterized protein n=1 Tax=viral metagenome TaxID=1070528 RepID=A0A6H1ZN51_9ZZZZ